MIITVALPEPPPIRPEGSAVTDGYGRVHGLDNVYVADGSVFVTSGAHNPTNTIMAVALRNMRHLGGS
jgi:choline dehydrogenase-like flavoprotein